MSSIDLAGLVGCPARRCRSQDGNHEVAAFRRTDPVTIRSWRRCKKAIVLLQGILADHSAGAGGGVGDNPGDEARSSFDAGLLTLTPGGAVTAPPLDERRQLSAAQRSTLVPPICVNWPSGVVQTLVRVICSRCGTDNPNRAGDVL
jgi:hypothetical protein